MELVDYSDLNSKFDNLKDVERDNFELSENVYSNNSSHNYQIVLIKKLSNLLKWLSNNIVQHYILFSLFTAILIAFSYPYLGSYFSNIHDHDMTNIIQFINVVIVFFISGITLNINDLKSIASNKFLILYGLISINFITTLVGFITRILPFRTTDYAIGLTIFCTVPTTLGVGIALTQISNGDTVLALLLTIISNILGILTIPFLLKIYLNSFSKVSINPIYLIYQLSLTVLIPTIFGIILRYFLPYLATFSKKYKSELSMFSMSNLMMIVWMNLSVSRNLIFKQDPVELILVLIANICVHSLYLLFNYVVAHFLMKNHIKLQQAIAITIMCSQKSSPVAISVIGLVSSQQQERGLLIIPCIIGQLTQIFMGSFISKRFAKISIDRQENETSEEQEQEIPLENSNEGVAKI